MSRREDYLPGVPCWVAVLVPDVEVAKRFYGAVLGWDFHDVSTGADPFFIATVERDPVASIAGPEENGTWITAVAVDDLAVSIATAVAAGGQAPGTSIDIPTLGRFHRLADPSGAEIHVAQLSPRGGAGRVNEPGAWAMSALHTSDVSAAVSFYSKLFGWETEEADGTMLFRLPGYVGGEEEQPVPRDVVAIVDSADQPPASAWVPDFWVHDADAAAAAAGREGGAVLKAVEDTGAGFRTAALADPSGAIFTVSQLLQRDDGSSG